MLERFCECFACQRVRKGDIHQRCQVDAFRWFNAGHLPFSAVLTELVSPIAGDGHGSFHFAVHSLDQPIAVPIAVNRYGVELFEKEETAIAGFKQLFKIVGDGDGHDFSPMLELD